MTLLASTLLALGIVAGRSGASSAPLGELPKAPVEIVVPAAPEKAPAPTRGAARPKVHILVLPPSLTKAPEAAVPSAPPEPAKAPPPPAVAPPAQAMPASDPASAPAPKGGEVVASVSPKPVPVERLPGYELVAQKCGRCHSVEKALHTHFSADEWDAYLKKKLRRNGAGISPQQAEEIGAFLRSLGESGTLP